MKTKTLLPTLLAAGLLAASAQAQTIIDSAGIWHTDGAAATDRSGAGDAAVGKANTNFLSAVTAFELPDLGGDTFGSATLNISLTGGSNAVKNVDNATVAVYVDIVSSATFNPATATSTDATLLGSFVNFVSEGADPIAPSGYTFLQSDLFTSSNERSDTESLSSGGASNLLSFLNSATFSAGDYLIVSFGFDPNGDEVTAFNDRYGITGSFTGNNTGNVREFEYTAIPEPSTFALFAGALGLAIVMVRRRRA